MIVAITILVGITGLILAFVFFLKKRKIYNKQLLPQQTQLVNELISNLQAATMVFEFQNDKYFESPLKCTLFDLVKFLDGKHRLSKEKYDDYQLFFANKTKQLLDFNKYLNNAVLPKVIKEELKAFQNTTFKKVSAKTSNFFKIYFPENDGTISSSELSGNLYEGNEDAYDTWLTLKESAHSLCFVLEQWMNENNSSKKPMAIIPAEELVLN